MGIPEHYSGSKCQKEALGHVDELIGYETAKEDKVSIEVLKDLRCIIELHWGE
nr:MAG: hypothetical protein [uncultured archaeon]